MERILLLAMSFILLKQITIGAEFNFIKYFKNRKEYLKKYNDWLRKKP